MADIDRELFDIWNGQFGYDIRMPIHDALMKIAWETPPIDPSQLPEYVFIVDNTGKRMISSSGSYAVVKNERPRFIIEINGKYMVSSDGSYAIIKE